MSETRRTRGGSEGGSPAGRRPTADGCQGTQHPTPAVPRLEPLALEGWRSPPFGTCSVEAKSCPYSRGSGGPCPAASEIQGRSLPRCGLVEWGHERRQEDVGDRRRRWGRTHVSATDALQQETGHFGLPVKLCLGHSELLLGLGTAEDEHQREGGPQPPPQPPSPTPRRPAQDRPPLPFWGRPHLPPGALTPGAATAPRGAPGGQFSAEQPAWGTLSGPFTLIHLPICKPNQPWPPEGPPYATGQVGSDRPATGPQGGRAQNWKPSRPQWQQVPAPPSPPPDSPCPPRRSRAAETTQGRSAGEGGGHRSAGEGRGGEDAEPQSPCLPSGLRPQTLLTRTLPNSLPTTRQGAEAGVRPGRGAGRAPTSPSIQSHMPHAGRGTASWEVLLGFLLQCTPPGSDWGLKAKVSRQRLAGWEAGPSDPGPVTEPFCPPVEKGSLAPESHWGSMAKEKNRAASTLQDISPSTRPRKGGRKCHPESKEERPPPPTTA